MDFFILFVVSVECFMCHFYLFDDSWVRKIGDMDLYIQDVIPAL